MSDELLELIDDAIELAMARHESLNDDSVCTCGQVNNMDGDVLFSHRVAMVSDAVHRMLDANMVEERRTLNDGIGGVSTNWQTGEMSFVSRPCTVQSRWVTPWLSMPRGAGVAGSTGQETP